MINGFSPYLWVALVAVLALLPGLAFFFGRGGPRDGRGRKRFRIRPVRRLFGLLLIALGGACALLAVSIVQFLRLTGDQPVASVVIHASGPEMFSLQETVPGKAPQDFDIRGDEFQIDARIVRWRLPALLAGVPPLYRLERLSGRYRDAARDQSAPRSVYSLDDAAVPDLDVLKRRFPNWLPFVDVQYGSAAFMPLLDNARYQVLMDPRGALFIRPADPATEAALHAAGW